MGSHALEQKEQVMNKAGNAGKRVVVRTVDRYTQLRGHKAQVYIRVELLQDKPQDTATSTQPITVTLEWKEFRWKERNEAFTYAKQLSKEHHAKVEKQNIFI